MFFLKKKTLAETRIEFEVQVFLKKKLEPRNLVFLTLLLKCDRGLQFFEEKL
jgi:hypothetical protein